MKMTSVVVLAVWAVSSAAVERPCDGGLWPDDRGVHINAHGGGVIWHEGRYYWYGEHKIAGDTGNAAHGIAVHCYSSADLSNWKDEGAVLTTSSSDWHDLEDGCIVERPKVVFCPKTKQFVLYFHLELKTRPQTYDTAMVGIAVNDRPAGLFTYIGCRRPNAGVWPQGVNPALMTAKVMSDACDVSDCRNGGENDRIRGCEYPFAATFWRGQTSRDQTLFVDDDGKAYHIYASEHNSTLHIAELSDDFINETGRYWRLAVKDWTEAPAICKHNGWYYILGSGCTGWEPNAARYYRSRSLAGPWERMGNPCRGTDEATGFGVDLTWGCQSTCIFPVQGRTDSFIAMFDRWCPENAIDGRYVWRPVRFEDGRMIIDWNDRGDGGCTRAFGDLAEYVDPFVGTAGTGHTTPAACVPFGMVQAGADTGYSGWEHCSGYIYGEKTIFGFTQTHLNGTGCPDLGDVRILPVGKKEDCPFDKGSEIAEPGYYAVTLTDPAVRVEVSASAHSSIYRLTAKADGELKLLVEPKSMFGKTTEIEKRVGEAGVSGAYRSKGWADRTIGYAVEFNRAARVGNQDIFSFDLKAGETLMAKVGLSGKSADGARQNLKAEIPGWDFDVVKDAARQKWNEVLGSAIIEGTDEQKKNWYTSLYHLCVQPNNIADVGANPFYSTFSCWDTFRAAGPLYTVLYPEKAAEFVDSMLEQGKRTGYLPIWTLWGEDNQCMIGTHSVPMIVDWFLKNGEAVSRPLQNKEGSSSVTSGQETASPLSASPLSASPLYWEVAYRQIKETLTKKHEGRIKENWDLYDQCGYYPFDKIRGESVSRTMECAYDDWCAGVMAEKLGHTEDASFFFKRSAYWKNVFDPSLGMVRGKDSKGGWRAPFDPYALGHGADVANDFTEGNAFQYSWHVMQAPEGLVAAMGGREKFAAKLDSLFTQPQKVEGMGEVLDVTGLIGQYVHGNEPSHHVIYFYPQVGHPEKAAERIREVFDKFYLPKPDGLCGNDDCGQMSAWYLFSAMGFYPFNPCGGEYVIGAPQVPKVTLEVGKRTPVRFVMTAKNLSKENKYVKSVTLNGKPITDWKIRHADIMNGGELVFEMCDRP